MVSSSSESDCDSGEEWRPTSRLRRVRRVKYFTDILQRRKSARKSATIDSRSNETRQNGQSAILELSQPNDSQKLKAIDPKEQEMQKAPEPPQQQKLNPDPKQQKTPEAQKSKQEAPKPEKAREETHITFPQMKFTDFALGLMRKMNNSENVKPANDYILCSHPTKHTFGSVRNYLIPSADAPNPAPWKVDQAKPPPEISYNINSVIVSASVGVRVDLKEIARNGINFSYNPIEFKGMIMRLKRYPAIQTMVFEPGHIVVSGGKNVDDSKNAARLICRNLTRWGAPNAKLFNLKVNNISATVRLDFKIRISKMLEEGARLGVFLNAVQLDPHAFTGVSLTVTIPSSDCTVVVFATGAMLITGIAEESAISHVISRVYPFLKLFAV